jgi:hypothetical protein
MALSLTSCEPPYEWICRSTLCEPLIHGVEYWDPKFLPYVISMKPGWLRFPGGTPGTAFNWQTGHMEASWLQEVGQKVSKLGEERPVCDA